jgi:SAM-dependent methyltransferase
VRAAAARREIPLPAESAAPLRTGLLGDTRGRDYARKLRAFNQFAAPEIQAAMGSLALKPGARILDAGCGTGEALPWLARAAGNGGRVLGVDLSSAHIAAAKAFESQVIEAREADLAHLELPPASFDLIWCVNTLNHFREPLQILQRLIGLLERQGRIAIGQSSLLPEMFFAWDSRLERVVDAAVRRYYLERYGLREQDLASVRSIAGLLRTAGLSQVSAKTFVIERLWPLDRATREYLLETIFINTWGERLRPYLSTEDYTALTRLCDPADDGFALDRQDFHFLQTFTLACGSR